MKKVSSLNSAALTQTTCQVMSFGLVEKLPAICLLMNASGLQRRASRFTTTRRSSWWTSLRHFSKQRVASMETMWLHVRAPFAAFRWFQAGVYRATHPIMPPSSAYGLLLNLGAIDMRDAVTGPITLIRSDTPLLRIAIGIVTPAERCSLYQQLHTYPVGNASAEFKPRTHGAKYHITPVRREVLIGLDCIIGTQSDDVHLFDRVRRGLKGELDVTRYGL